MLAKPTMIKRPVLEVGDRILVGFKADVYEAAVGSRASRTPHFVILWRSKERSDAAQTIRSMP